jgi:predicted amidophosphoribosyltransferase
MEEPLDAVVHEFKYGGREDLARPLARLLSERIETPRADLVVPVPLHRTRLRERGYNQAGLLARAAAPVWRAPPVEGLLVRSRPTRAQARLPEDEREDNVKGAFSVREPTWVAELGGAGAERVVPVVLALA